MARNEEKQLGKLNRLFLHKEREEYCKKHPKRPKLSSLNTVEEVQEWIPSIKDDLNFYLSECQVSCYPEQKIVESQQKVLRLEKEFKAFVRKIRMLSPECLEAIPWTCRPYKSKNEDSVPLPCKRAGSFIPIATPLLDAVPAVEENNLVNSDLVSMDEPLEFRIENAKEKHVKEFFKGPKLQKMSNDLSVNVYTSTDVVNLKNSALKLTDSLVPQDVDSLGNNKQDALAILENKISCQINPFETFHASEGSVAQKEAIYNNVKECTYLARNECLLGAACKEEESSQSLSYSSKPVGNILGLDYNSTSESE